MDKAQYESQCKYSSHNYSIIRVKLVSNNFCNKSCTGRKLAAAVLEGENPKDFLRRHNLRRTRLIQVLPDSSHPGYYNIPVYDYARGRYANMFKAEENPKLDFKERLQVLLRTRKGYAPGDVFVTPWGRFLVTDVMGVKEV